MDDPKILKLHDQFRKSTRRPASASLDAKGPEPALISLLSGDTPAQCTVVVLGQLNSWGM